MTLEEHIEKAAKELVLKSGCASFEDLPTVRRLANIAHARGIIYSAFPELFTDPPTKWLAPMEPDEHSAREFRLRGWDRYRDHVLNRDKKE